MRVSSALSYVTLQSHSWDTEAGFLTGCKGVHMSTGRRWERQHYSKSMQNLTNEMPQIRWNQGECRIVLFSSLTSSDALPPQPRRRARVSTKHKALHRSVDVYPGSLRSLETNIVAALERIDGSIVDRQRKDAFRGR